VALTLTEPVLFRRRARRGAQVRKVCVSLTPEWFETVGGDYAAACELAGLGRQHLAIRHWQPSARLLALVEQMLSPPDYNPLLQHLYLESRALEIASEAMSLASGQFAPSQPGLRPQEHQRIRRTLELLQSDTADNWSLERIAQEIGVNVSTLQRQFQASQGMSLFEYQRRRKLLQAREALERQGVSVSYAAWQAGYSSAANFSTAFKRAFGLTPKQARARI
jgi:AraC-like DNA-binding protein